MPQTEKQSRKSEELRSVQDYYDEIQLVWDLGSSVAGQGEVCKDVDKIVLLLIKGLLQKYKYIIKMSAKWRKKQGLFSRIRDTLIERQEAKNIKEELEKEALLEQLSKFREKAKKASESENKDCTTSSSTALVVTNGGAIQAQTELSENKEGEQLSLLEF